MITTPSLLGYREEEYSPRREAAQFEQIETGTLTSVSANLRQSWEWGRESFLKATEARTALKAGTPIDEEQYKASPYYREDTPYFKGMTLQYAAVTSQWKQDKEARQIRIDKADTVGIGTAAYILGSIAEPFNVAATALTAGTGGFILNSSRMGAHLAAKSSLAARMGAYGVEGLVGAAITEPTNIYSSKILREDYTMADSAMNLVSSTLASAVLGAGGSLLKDRQARKVSARKAYQEATETLDTATKQLVLGQRVDIEPVIKLKEGSIAKKPTAEKAAIIENFVNEKTRPILDNTESLQLAISNKEIPSDIIESFPQPVGAERVEVPLIESLPIKEDLAPRTKKDLETPASWVIRDRATGKPQLETFSPEVVNKINTSKYEAVPIIEHLANLNGQTYYKGDVALTRAELVRQAIFGADDIDAVAERIDNQSTDLIRQAAIKANDPLNDTAIDLDAANLADQYDVELQARTDELILAEQRISDLKEQGLLDNDDLAALEAMSEFNPKDYMSALDAAYICMTRG